MFSGAVATCAGRRVVAGVAMLVPVLDGHVTCPSAGVAMLVPVPVFKIGEVR